MPMLSCLYKEGMGMNLGEHIKAELSRGWRNPILVRDASRIIDHARGMADTGAIIDIGQLCRATGRVLPDRDLYEAIHVLLQKPCHVLDIQDMVETGPHTDLQAQAGAPCFCLASEFARLHDTEMAQALALPGVQWRAKRYRRPFQGLPPTPLPCALVVRTCPAPTVKPQAQPAPGPENLTVRATVRAPRAHELGAGRPAQASPRKRTRIPEHIDMW